MSSLHGVRCLVTAGPTYEAIDPVRFIGNRSSGKMGIAIAEELGRRGAKVTLILGPSSLTVNNYVDQVIRVESADDMLEAVKLVMPEAQLGIFAAAVADYKPVKVESQKIKKNDDQYMLKLIKNTDILLYVGSQKRSDQVLVGFALETQNELENAKKKLVKKNLDMIVLNSLNNPKSGFQYDTNQITLIDKNNNIVYFELKTKVEVARDIVNSIETNFF